MKPLTPPTKEEKEHYYESISNLYEEAEYISSEISSFKLQSADGIKCKVPEYWTDYKQMLYDTKSRDFSDMLIEVRDLLKEEKWLNLFRGQYDYIFVDEYQDTSAIQMQILLALNAKFYYLMGDRAQSIFGFSGSNAKKIEELLKNRRNTVEMNLSKNFRSGKVIVENSNRHSDLKAVPHHAHDGYVDGKIMLQLSELEELLKTEDEVAILVRTNAVIKTLELKFLKDKLPMKYFNFITPTDIKNYRKGEITEGLKRKFDKLKHDFYSEKDIVDFIELHANSNKFITSIHKSKGREFHTVVVINSICPEMLDKHPSASNLPKKMREKITFDPYDEDDIEPKNIHYVAVSRPKNNLYFMIYLP